MKTLRHVASLGLLSFAFAALLAGPVGANTCGPSPQCNPDDPTTGACCNASTCTFAPANTACIDPTAVCENRKCDGTTHTCTVGSQQQASQGTPCYPSTNQCVVGECDSNGHCLNPTDNRCVDLDPCTVNTCNTNGSGTFTGCDFSQQATDGTECSTTDNGVCHVKTCQSGVCTDSGQTKNCTPSGDLCNPNLCVIQNGVAVCQVIQQPTGTSCDTTPLDCKFQTCRGDGTCGNQAAPNGSTCDTNAADDPSHCQLGQCNGHKECLAATSFPVAAGVTSITVGSPSGPITIPTCASDNNACTSDECDGSGACRNRCDTTISCGNANCPGCCALNGSTCGCAAHQPPCQ